MVDGGTMFEGVVAFGGFLAVTILILVVMRAGERALRRWKYRL